MRIQETDRILKEARYQRRDQNHEDQSNMLSRAWKRVISMFHR